MKENDTNSRKMRVEYCPIGGYNEARNGREGHT